MIDVKNQVSIYSKLHGVSFYVIRGSGLLMLFSGCKVSRRVLSLLTLETSGTELRLPWATTSGEFRFMVQSI